MFGFLKKKLKDTVDKFGEAEEELQEKTEEPTQIETKEEAEDISTHQPTPEYTQREEIEEKREPILDSPVPTEDATEIETAEKVISKPQTQQERDEIIQDVEELVEDSKEESFEERLAEVKEDFEKKKEEITEEDKERSKKSFVEKVSEKVKEVPEKKGLFSRVKEKVTTVGLSESKFNELFDELEISLLENSVAVDVIDKIKKDLHNDVVGKNIKRGQLAEEVRNSLRASIQGLFFEATSYNILDKVEEKKPYVILFVGINGSGKTTSIAKIAHLLKESGKSVVVSASDTFRAAAIQQMEEHTNKLGIKLIKHDYGSDPAAVAFDTIKYAKAKDIDVVLVDTAGRLQSNTNLMQEMEKIVRVAKPDLKLFVGEAITGNDCVEQARKFNETVGIDGIILAKADVDEKGGAAISASYVTKKPILYLGTGQTYDDLTPFSATVVINNLGLGEA